MTDLSNKPRFGQSLRAWCKEREECREPWPNRGEIAERFFITQDEALDLIEGITQSSGNNARPIDLLRERVEALAVTANLWERGPEHLEMEENAARAVDFDQQLFAALKALEAARDEEVRPHRDAADAARAAWKPLETTLTEARSMMARKLKPYLSAHGSVRGEVSGKLVGLRKEWRAVEITDRIDLYAWLLEYRLAALNDFIVKEIGAAIRAGARDIPGVRIEQVEV